MILESEFLEGESLLAGVWVIVRTDEKTARTAPPPSLRPSALWLGLCGCGYISPS